MPTCPAPRRSPRLAELADLGVQGVTITTPTATHAPLAHEALGLGLHVVVDKPFALTASDARDLVDHAARVGRVITPYQNRRWDSDLLTLKKLIADDALGTVHSFTSRIDRFRPVKGSWHGGTVAEGGGTLLDLGPHLVDQALHLFGPVVAVHAELRTVRPGAGAEDVIELHLTHAGGVRSTLAAGMASAAPGTRFLVNGTRGGFLIDGFDIQEEQLKAGEIAGLAGRRAGASSRNPPGAGCSPRTAPGRCPANAAGGTPSIRPSPRRSPATVRRRSIRGTRWRPRWCWTRPGGLPRSRPWSPSADRHHQLTKAQTNPPNAPVEASVRAMCQRTQRPSNRALACAGSAVLASSALFSGTFTAAVIR